ncbi:MAG: response regulator [Candidatus Tectomicrobia bacterium]|nr:response regulator [Candidatus Tectomicrobia bacterium]
MNEKILVVDDQKSMCWILSKILTEAGFSVETAGTAAEALVVVANGKISAIILDYRLPDMNGIELFEKTRKQNSQIPAILITSYGSKTLKEEALRIGFAEYFDKPFNNQALLEVLKQLLAKNRELAPAGEESTPPFSPSSQPPPG